MNSATSSPITRVDLDGSEPEFLYRIETTSATVYYLRATDARGLEVLRAWGGGNSTRTAHDHSWQRCQGIYSAALPHGYHPRDDPFDGDDILPMVLRVGAIHRYNYYVPGGYADTTDYWWRQRAVTRIVRLDEMPPEGQWTKTEGVVERPEGV